MIAAQGETIPEAVADTMITRVFQVARLLAAVRAADTCLETVENRVKNQQAHEVRYGETDRTAHTIQVR
jgi:DNA-binding response OmpR family regulator